MPFTTPCGHFSSSFLMFAPPPQPQSRTFPSAGSVRNPIPHRASARWPKFIMATMISPPKPAGLRVFSKKDIFLPPQRFSITMILLEIFRTAVSLSSTL